MLNVELTETTVEDKIRRLISLFTTTPFENIGLNFDVSTGIDKTEPDFFNVMMADALCMKFNCLTDPEDISNLKTVQDFVDRVNNSA